MFKSFIKEYNRTRKTIDNEQSNQKERLKEFDVRHQNTIESMNKRRKNFEERKSKIQKELTRHFWIF